MTAVWEYLTDIAFEPSMTVQNAVTCTAVLLLFAERDRSRNRWSGLLLEFLGLFTALVAMNGVWEALFHRPGSYFATHLLLMAGYVLWLGRLNSRQYLVTIILFYAVETAGIVLSSIIPEILLPDSYGTLEIVLRNLAVLSTLAAAAFFGRRAFSASRISTRSALYTPCSSARPPPCWQSPTPPAGTGMTHPPPYLPCWPFPAFWSLTLWLTI